LASRASTIPRTGPSSPPPRPPSGRFDPEAVARQLLPTLGTVDHQLAPWAVDWLVEAAPVVLNQAPAVAAELLAAACREVDRDDPRRIALTTRLAAALHSVGRVGDAIELIEQALSQVDDAELFTALHVTLAKCRTIIGQYELSRAELIEASTNPALGDRHRSRLRSTLAQQYVNLNRIDAAEPAAQEALAEVAAVWSLAGDELAALHLTNQAGAEADRDPNLTDLQLAAYVYRGMAEAALDRIEDAEATLRRAERLAERIGNHAKLVIAQSWLACLLYDTARWDEAVRAATLAGQGPNLYANAEVEGVAALIALHRGDAAGGRRHLATGNSCADRLDGKVIGYLWLARALERETRRRSRRCLGNPARGIRRAQGVRGLIDCGGAAGGPGGGPLSCCRPVPTG
jgi:tetratricopeptide (TPR) repeat protein